MRLTINGEARDIPADWRDETLLHALREGLGLTGAKFGCGVGQCGACTVIIDGAPRRACLESPRDLEGAEIETIEGLAGGDGLHPVQSAWLEARAPQCGYCQAGQIMSAVALLRETPKPTDADIDEAMAGNLCRCGTYRRIRAAIHRAAEAQS
ncbi:MAG: (2Fe-2S)-binding protein [Pseudomonadota bacterium]